MKIDSSITNPAELPGQRYHLLIAALWPTQAAAEQMFARAGLPTGDDVTVFNVRGDWYYPAPQEGDT